MLHADYKLGDYERLQRSNKSNSIKEKRKIMVQQLELLGECQRADTHKLFVYEIL